MRAGGAPRRLRASDTAPATPEPTQNQRRTTASRTRAHSRDAAEQSERARLGASPTRVDGVEATDPQTGLTRPTTPPATRFDPASVSRSTLDFPQVLSSRPCRQAKTGRQAASLRWRAR